MSNTVLQVEDLTVSYLSPQGRFRAVDGVSFTIHQGETFGLVGESGSGKTTTAMAILNMIKPPARVEHGRILLEGVDLLAQRGEALRRLRWSRLSFIPQGAQNALNPVITIGAQFDDLLRVHRPALSESARWARYGVLLNMVGMNADRLRSYPHELSGGMRQRAMIAMAIALEPQVMILDEPTTALDVVTQREILQELIGLRDRIGFATLFITHDLSLLVELADEIAVMYAGRLMERAPATSLFHAPRLPYTYALLHCFPPMHGPRVPMEGLKGSPPDMRDLPPGCAFHPRCQWALPRCRQEVPRLAPLNPVALF